MNVDQDWIPTENEINEYAEYIGIDPKREPELLWIAREGLKAPLPPNWIAKYNDDGDVFYMNTLTKQQMFDHPLDQQYYERVIKERSLLKSKKSAPKDDLSFKPASLSESSKIASPQPYSTPLKPVPLDEYMPAQEEVIEYARYIGIDPEREPELLYIAEEGLRAPAPAGYTTTQTPDGEIQYINLKTKEVSFDHPLDDEFRAKVIAYRKIIYQQKITKGDKTAPLAASTSNVQVPPANQAISFSSAPAIASDELYMGYNSAKKASLDIQEIPPFRERPRAPSPPSYSSSRASSQQQVYVSKPFSMQPQQIASYEAPDVQLSKATPFYSISSTLQNDFANEILKITNAHAEEIKRILRAQSTEIAGLNRYHQEKIRELEKTNFSEISEIRRLHEHEIAEVRKTLNAEWIDVYRQQIKTAQGTTLSTPFEQGTAENQRLQQQVSEQKRVQAALQAELQQLAGDNQRASALLRQMKRDVSADADYATSGENDVAEGVEGAEAHCYPQYIDIFTQEANVVLYALPDPFRRAILRYKYLIYHFSQFLTTVKPKIDLQIRALEAKRSSFSAEMELFDASSTKQYQKQLYLLRKQLDAEGAQVGRHVAEFKRAQQYILRKKAAVQHLFDSINILPAYPYIYAQCHRFYSQTTKATRRALLDFAACQNGWITPPLQQLDESLRMQPQLDELQGAVASLLRSEERVVLDGVASMLEDMCCQDSGVMRLEEGSGRFPRSSIYEMLQGFAQFRYSIDGGGIVKRERLPTQLLEFGVRQGLFERSGAANSDKRLENLDSAQEGGQRRDEWMDVFRKELM